MSNCRLIYFTDKVMMIMYCPSVVLLLQYVVLVGFVLIIEHHQKGNQCQYVVYVAIRVCVQWCVFWLEGFSQSVRIQDASWDGMTKLLWFLHSINNKKRRKKEEENEQFDNFINHTLLQQCQQKLHSSQLVFTRQNSRLFFPLYVVLKHLTCTFFGQ